jgi:5-methylthioadenosine/S-adenosylhomocysteine deaminase
VGFTIQNVLIPGAIAGLNPDMEPYESSQFGQPHDSSASHLVCVDVHIEADRIAAIAPNLPAQGTVIDGRNKLLLPGFVNAHTHSSEIWQRGIIPPYPLELWLAELHDFTPLEPEQAYLSAVVTAVETLLSGGTSIVDHLVLMPGQELETIDAVVRAYRDVGIRAFMAPLLQDQPLPAGLPTGGHFPRPDYALQTQEMLDILTTAIAQHHDPSAGITLVAAPTGIQLCSDALFEGCVDLSDRHQLPRHAHLLETKAQQLLAQEKYGCTAVAHLRDLGFLGPRTSLAHCVWLTDADIEILAATRSTVVHNPLSNLRLGSGIAPVLKYRQAGVNVTFGCDGAASNDGQDLLEAIKIGSMLHNTTDFEYRHWITPRQSVAMASQGGAQGLGLADQFGTLAVGQQADLVLYDLTNLSLLPRTDAIGLLVWGRPTQAVWGAWVAGQPVIAEGKVTTVDVDQLRQQLFDQSQWTGDRTSAMLAKIEPQYRQIMGLQ